MAVHDVCMTRGVTAGWWPTFDDKGPHPWPFHFNIKTGELRREVFVPEWAGEGGIWVVLGTFDFKFMSQLVTHLGGFESVSDARKSGLGTPIAPCDFWFRKNKPGTLHIEIVDED